jgi:hypothetical protein
MTWLKSGIMKAKQKRFTLEDAQIKLQASEQEIAQALKEKHMLIIDGEIPLRRILACAHTLAYP